MSNRKYAIVRGAVVLLAMTALTGCSLDFGFGKNEPAPIAVAETPTPEPEELVTPEPTISPNMQGTTYTAADKSFSIKLPDETWTIKAEEAKVTSFESPDQGGILILHGQGEELDAVVLPDTRDLAVSLEQAADMAEGTDFEVLNYTPATVGSVEVYSYVVHYMDLAKSEGTAYTANRYFVAGDEYYSLVGTAKDESVLASIGTAIDSFKVTSGAISAAATGVVEEVHNEAAPETPDTAAPAEGAPVLASDQNDTDYTEEALADTDQTRTIYRNSDGEPIVITPDGEGNWVDAGGNSYWFDNDSDVFDQYDVDYYWHGEAGDVAFMPTQPDLE